MTYFGIASSKCCMHGFSIANRQHSFIATRFSAVKMQRFRQARLSSSLSSSKAARAASSASASVHSSSTIFTRTHFSNRSFVKTARKRLPFTLSNATSRSRASAKSRYQNPWSSTAEIGSKRC